MSAPDDPAGEARRDEARRWLAIARDDIDVAIAAIDLSRPRAGVAAYHLQQAAEKRLKSMLVWAGHPFRRTHDLDDLAHQAAPFYPQWAPRLEALRPLTVWGVAYRYPGLEDEPEPTLAELRQAADEIREMIRRFDED